MIVYVEDTKGDKIYTVYVIDAQKLADINRE